jgi:hypothetical protein
MHNLPIDVVHALETLGEDVRRLRSFFSYETGEYIGVGLLEHDTMTRLCDADKAAALDVIDKQIRFELSQMGLAH